MRVDVIATTISGSIADWKKVERIVPGFAERGLDDVRLHEVDSHAAAYEKTVEVLREGGRLPISAGGSGTFRRVMEGCCDSGVPLDELRLGFLRKGSADLIGKILGMPDEIEPALDAFAEAIREDRSEPCDILRVENVGGEPRAVRIVGYGGAGLFGRIPHYTENRFMKWYKGILSQFFGDLGPFTTGMLLSLLERLAQGPLGSHGTWRITVDGVPKTEGRYQALILVNGYLGPQLPYSKDRLGSGRFQLFGLRDQGLGRLVNQARAARSGAILEDPDRWGLETFTSVDSLELRPEKRLPFPVNVDGSTLRCDRAVRFSRIGQIRLLAGKILRP